MKTCTVLALLLGFAAASFAQDFQPVEAPAAPGESLSNGAVQAPEAPGENVDAQSENAEEAPAIEVPDNSSNSEPQEPGDESLDSPADDAPFSPDEEIGD